jgi:hypothetical protein
MAGYSAHMCQYVFQTWSHFRIVAVVLCFRQAGFHGGLCRIQVVTDGTCELAVSMHMVLN